ncbi:MAG: DUF5615 family PIN-like protein [Pseudonocardia sp.]
MNAAEPLLLDEMFAPALVERLRADGFDVVAVAGHPVLASSSDAEVASWAARHGRRVVTENVRDFAPLASSGDPPVRVLFTSSRRFPRSRRNPSPLLEALRAWRRDPAVQKAPLDWLR